VKLKGLLRVFTSIARAIVRRQIAKLVLRPMKAIAEAAGSAGAI
jgi:hypothetical protein